MLVLSLRLVSPPVAAEMLDAWFSTEPDPSEAEAIASLDGAFAAKRPNDTKAG